MQDAEQPINLVEVRILDAGRRGFSFRDFFVGACGFSMALLSIGAVAIGRMGYLEGFVFTHSSAQLGQAVDGGYAPKPPHPGTTQR